MLYSLASVVVPVTTTDVKWLRGFKLLNIGGPDVHTVYMLHSDLFKGDGMSAHHMGVEHLVNDTVLCRNGHFPYASSDVLDVLLYY